MYINYYQLEEQLIEMGVPIEAGESNLKFFQYKLCQLHIKDFAFISEDHWFQEGTIEDSSFSWSWYGAIVVWPTWSQHTVS